MLYAILCWKLTLKNAVPKVLYYLCDVTCDKSHDAD